MYRDKDINAYERCIKASKKIMPHHYFLTTVFENWEIVDRLDKPIRQIALTDCKVLARYSKSHLFPLIGVNDDKKRKCHYHAILLSEKPLNFDSLHKFNDGRSMDIRDYDGRRDCLIYTGRKHLPFYQTNVIHPRMKSGCKCNQCSISRALRRHIPK
jgi:hypothetical protein